jgi:hypothetical protein
MELDPQSVFGGFGAAEQNEPVADLVPPLPTRDPKELRFRLPPFHAKRQSG